MSPADVFQKLVDDFNRHDPDAYAADYAPNAIVHDPAYGEPLEGRDAVRDDAAAFFRAFPDLHGTTQSLLIDGQTCAGEVHFAGTHTGPLPLPTGEIPPTGRRVEFRVAGFLRLDGRGRVLESRRYYDVAGIFAQLEVPV